MSDVIRLLPESIANQIAAGEVVPAPAYIVKELLENSIDAGASEVQVEILGAGREAVQVTDNGKGMSPTDARMAFERHATSKLREIEDLDRLSTMGFRGEALAAIASVCQVELRTRIAELEVGTELRIEGARVKSSVPVACPVGTTLRAMNIFYNTPGRRKHIEARKESTELGDIWKEFAKVALANAEVSFALRGTGKYDKSLPASSLKERIIGIGGSKLSKALIPVNYESSFCSIRGFIGTPTTALKSGAQQYFFVNNRFIRHPYFHKAVMLAYEKFIPVGTQPHYFLYFTIPAENIDVNIHPQKTDVRFLDGETIFQVIVSLLREAFSSHALAPTIDFDQEGSIEIPAYQGRRDVVLDLDEQYRLEGGEANLSQGVPSLSPSGVSGIRRTLSGRSFRPKEPQPNWDDLGEHFDTMSFSPREEEQLFDLPAPEDKALQGVRLSTGKPQQLPPLFTASSLMFQGRYVVTTLGESLALVDIRRAQLRIIYDGYLTGITSHAYSSEQPLFPEVLEFTPTELPTAIEVMAELSKLGFDFGDLGDGHFSVAEAPSLLAREAINFVRLIVADSLDTHRSGEGYVRSFLAEAAAEAEVLQMPLPRTSEEVSDLLSELTSSSDAYFTPSGKSIIALLPESMIGSFFS
jgi:DNA mismatch repair protein mutL